MGLTRIRAEQINNIDYKQAVRVITLANIILAGSAPAAVDGVNLSIGDRVLVAGNSDARENGIYVVNILGSGSSGTWVRSNDTNQTGELQAGAIVMVTEGAVYADTQWKLTTNDPIVIGTSELVFEQNSAFAFGNIWANGTAVLADVVGDTVTFSSANNLIITGNDASDTITFEVSQSPTFTGNVSGGNITTAGTITSTGNVTGGNLVTAGQANIGTLTVNGVSTFAGNLFPSANVTYNLGSPTQRWNDLWLSNSTIYIGNAQISANASAITITNPQGGQTVLSGTSSAVEATTVTATGNITGRNLTANGNVEIQNRGILYLNDSDNSNYIGFRSPATLTGNFVYIFPTNYGNSGQVLGTNGAGGLSWVDGGGGGGGGSATQFPNSTVQPVPGSTGNFDLSFNFVQTSQEIPFETSATDAFGVNLGEVYSMMDPVGEILDPVDLGVLT